MPSSLSTRPLRPGTPPERLTGPLPGGVDPGDALPYQPAGVIPTMLVPRELNYLHWLAARTRGTGRVVELGCFLGGSTAALDAGREHAQTVGPFGGAPLLVYDAFEMPDAPEIAESWWMKPFGLAPGQRFREVYEKLHRERLGRLEIHEGWIPPEADAAGERTLYPAQDPIELLFVDAAKTWETHVTILRTFGRHMKPGGVLVQQDHMDLLPWLSVHMWQLRECFEPLDLVRGAPSLSFRCTADPAEALGGLFPNRRAFASAGPGLWDEIAAYWEDRIPGIGRRVARAHQAVEAYTGSRAEEMTGAARRYEEWTFSAASRGVYVSPFWADWLPRFAKRAAEKHAGDRTLSAARGLNIFRLARASMPSQGAGTGVPLESRAPVWESVLADLAGNGVTRVALYGAGRHTAWLLGEDGPLRRGAGPVAVACVVDDTPAAEEIAGVPVVLPDDPGVLMTGVAAVIPSSDYHEPRLLARAQRLASRYGATAVPVYTRGDQDSVFSEQRRRPDPSAHGERHGLIRVSVSDLAAGAGYRDALGLRAERPWLDAFAEAYAVPAWASGYVNHRDGLLLWDLVEAVRPRAVVEVGVSSGVSSALLASALRRFAGPTDQHPRLLSVDIASRCHFDASRTIGEAIAEINPVLASEIELRTGWSAVDAARACEVGSVDLAFIDGNHLHPAPTLDLIALLPVMRPGAWVALHDIELPHIAKAVGGPGREHASGAQRLFRAWPFEKIQPENPNPVLNNIGAVRIPADPEGDLAGVLVSLLREPWETGQPTDELREALATVEIRARRTCAPSG